MKIIMPEQFKKACKDADIRGVYGSEINGAVAYYVAYAFVTLHKYKTVVVGHDMRESAAELTTGFINGVRDAGADVISIGMVATPQLYFASGSLNIPGVMITASHSPREYNGMKLVHAGAIPLTKKNGLADIYTFLQNPVVKVAKTRGRVSKKSIDTAYIQYLLAGVDKKKYQGLHIATDIGNGMASDIVPLLQKRLPITFETLFAEPDGRFPNRDSDPNLRENQIALDTKIDNGSYDFGISFDGDADRIAFLDERGNYINSAVIGALIAARLLAREPKAKIVHTNLTSKIFEETILAHGGKPIRARVGHTFLKEAMRKRGAIFGAEHSGHFFFRDFFYTDSVVMTLLEVLDAYVDAKSNGQTFGEMMKPYMVYHQTEDIVIPVAHTGAAMKHIKQFLEQKNPDNLIVFDGYFVDFGTVWGAVKVSVTEYAIKLMCEAKTKKAATALQKELVAFVKSIAHETK